jgi:hypothetical protein
VLATLGGPERSPAAIVPAIFGAVEGFAGMATQSDDIAILAARYVGPA